MVVLRGPAQLRRTRRPARAVTPNQEVTDAAVPATLSPDGRLAGDARRGARHRHAVPTR